MNNTILLTACINTNNCAFLARSDSKDRENDYYNALEKWLTNTTLDFVFVENSNADLTRLKELASQHGDRVEFLQFDGNEYERGLGKGHGENIATAYAVDNSIKLQNEDFIHKVSGRYYLTEIANCIFQLKELNYFDNIDIIAHYNEALFNGGSIPTVYYGMRKEIYNKTLRNFHVNDSNGHYLELGMFITAVNLPHERVVFLNVIGLEPDQVTGTTNATIDYLQ